MNSQTPNRSAQQGAKKPLCCLRCGAPMKQVYPENYQSGSLLVKQLAKVISGAGIRVFHCTRCGKIEFFKKPEAGGQSSAF